MDRSRSRTRIMAWIIFATATSQLRERGELYAPIGKPISLVSRAGLRQVAPRRSGRFAPWRSGAFCPSVRPIRNARYVKSPKSRSAQRNCRALHDVRQRGDRWVSCSLAYLNMNKVPRTVWVLGFVSLCMDFSSELVHGLLPVFMTAVLGASMLAVGVVEGIAEATASIVKVFSGVLSDRLGRRKPLVVLGYALAAASKPLFPLAGSVALVLVARFMDRVGKGIRGAPRDALIADVTPAAVRGAAYGLRQALDT